MVAKAKSSYKVHNWRNYTESLVERGSITFWFSDDAIAQWEHANDEPKVGHPFVYSDRAIESLLVLRELFRLPYRQTEGLGRSLVQLMQINVAIPDFTSLAKRAASLEIALDVASHQGPIQVVVDSTGLKVFGEGEWKTRQHGISKRRTWRKLHLAVNPATQEIEAECKDRTAWQFGSAAAETGRGDSRNSPGRSKAVEGKRGVSSSQPGRNRHVPHKVLFWTAPQKPGTQKPAGRSTTAMQNPKPLHPTRTASLRVELVYEVAPNC